MEEGVSEIGAPVSTARLTIGPMDVVSMMCDLAGVHQRVEAGNAEQAFAGHAEEGVGAADGGAENRQRSKSLHCAGTMGELETDVTKGVAELRE